MKKLLLVFLLLLSFSEVYSREVCLYYFYQEGCRNCESAGSFIDTIEKDTVTVKRIDIRESVENFNLLWSLSAKFNASPTVTPVVAINNKIVEYDNQFYDSIASEVEYCLREGCACPSSEGAVASPSSGINGLTFIAVVVGAFLDSINPCEFAVIIILISAILTRGDRKKAFKSGLAFSLAVFIVYFLMCFGLFNIIKSFGISTVIFRAVSIVAIIIGLLNIKDAFWYGRGGFVIEVPMSWRPAMKGIIRRVTSPPGAFFVGVIVSLFLTPCTSGPYIVILGLLSDKTSVIKAIPLLLVYNIIFIMPMIFLTFILSRGFSIEKAESIRRRNLKSLHFITGVLMLVLGLAMLLGWI